MSDEELFRIVNEKLHKTISIDAYEIETNAYNFIRNNKHKIIDFFLEKKNLDKKIFFMAGSSGAGKSEMATTLQDKYDIDVIDTDEIRKLCPKYNGKNSNLFQKASSRGVSILINEAFKKEYSFILDGNFSDFNIQKENIQRALKRDYDIEILYIYRPLDTAKEYTRLREEREGRKVPDNIFYEKFINSINTVNKIKKEFQKINITFYDLYNNCKVENVENVENLINQQEIKYAKNKMHTFVLKNRTNKDIDINR
ncbi:MAG: zeta toxin family protein [Arcobacter sp.]|nr:zeta toxin family protein [Arcobacter sp.]